MRWSRRAYSPDDFEAGDEVNRTLTAANAALYGLVHAVICSVGAVPALGVVHSGTDRAFVYDIADLYKAEISIPATFDTLAAGSEDPVRDVRRAVRDRVTEAKLLRRVVADIHTVLGVVDDLDAELGDLLLWSDLQPVPSGTNWDEERHLP